MSTSLAKLIARLVSLPQSTRWLLAAAAFFYLTLTLQENFRLGLAAPALTCWILSLALFLAYYRQLDREQGIHADTGLDWRRRDSRTVVALLLLALLPRVLGVSYFPLAMHNDAGALSFDAIKVLDMRIHNPFALGWYSHPTLWAYLNSMPIRILGPTLTAARILPALIGALTVATTYLLVLTLYNRSLALISAILLATFPLHIHFSRIALNNIADPLFGTLTITLLTLALRSGRRFYFGLTGITVGLALYFYHGARLFVPLSILLACLWILSKRDRSRPWWHLDQWIALSPLLAGILFTAGPLLYIFIKRPQSFVLRFAKEGLSESVLTRMAESTGQSTVGILLDHLWRALLFFPLHADTNFDFYDRERPIVWGLAALLMLLGLLITLLRARQWRYQVPLAWYGLTALFAGMLMDYPIKTPRYITLAPVACLFIALAIQTGTSWLGRIHTRLRPLGIALAAGAVLYLSGSHLYGYFVDYRSRETYGNFSSEAATMLARQLVDEPRGTELWFLGNRWISVSGFPIFDYLAPQIDGTDIPYTLVGTHHVPTPSNDTPSIYAAVLEREDELRVVAARYPDGTWSRVKWPIDGADLLVLYRLEP